MSIEDKKSRNVYKPQMIIRLPGCPEYDHFTEIMSEIYDTVIAHDTDEMIEMVMGPREHLACIVVDAKRGIEYNFDMHKKMKSDMRFVSVPTVVLTLEHSREDMLACIKEGISDYIVLPEEDELVRLRVNNAIRSKDSATFAEIENMLKQLPSNIYLKDSLGRYVFATHYWHHLNDAEDREWTIRGKTDIDIRKDKENARLAFEADQRIIKTGEGTNYIIEEKSDGKTEYLELIKRPVFDNNGNVSGIIGLINDVTEQQLLKMELEERSKLDRLTGLYTKEHLIRRISEKLNNRELDDYYIAFIDIRNFKIVNDIFGREFGDYALKKVADWIRGYSNEECIYGRLAGDTFGSCLPKRLVNQDFIERDLKVFNIQRGDLAYHLEMNIGFCDITDQDKDVSILFDRARLALTPIRDDYKTHVAFYDSRMKEKVSHDQKIISRLATALSEDQILPYLQPIADRNGKIVGAEALARWIHPEQGFMSPADFIPLFEGNGMIVDVDKHIWRSVCRILADWKDKYPDLFISVNISPKDFYLTDVLSDVSSMVKEYGIEPKKLRIEVTETSMMNNTDDRMKILQEFRDLGFIVEMDDFGSGFSSLNMLKDMPVDVVKIDMRFLGRSTDDQKANIIVKNVIKLTEDLGIQSLTEGVETIDQFNMLSDMGCLMFQGYYFSKPVPRAEFEETILQKTK